MKAKITGGLLAVVLAVSLIGGSHAQTQTQYTRDRAGDLVQVDNGEIITWFCVFDGKVYALADLPQVGGCAYAVKHSR